MTFVVRPTPLRGVLAGALLAVVVAAKARLAPDALILPGLRLGGEAVPPAATEAALRAWVEERGRERQQRRVALVDEAARELAGGALADFGAHVDVDATVAQVVAVGRGGDLLERTERAARARRGAIDVPLVIALDERVARERIGLLKAAGDAPPVSARLDLDGASAPRAAPSTPDGAPAPRAARSTSEEHGVVPEVFGRYLDTDAALAALQRAAESDPPPSAVVLPFTRFAPRFTRESLAGLDIHAVLASYETYFSRARDQARRGANIDVAAAKLDGLVLMPGELFSFNEAVGDRSEENGFQRSWEIHKGEMIEGVGGGTCQVASTLYAAALFSGLDVLERLPHSRPSAYVPMGLDATVVYPDVDMKLRNPYEFPVALHAKVDGNRLRIELLGRSRLARSVEFTREIVETLPYEREVEEDLALRGTRVRVRQHGIAGYTIKRTRIVSLAGGREKREEAIDTYPPTMEIDEVPVGFDESLLPPLPGAPAVVSEDGASAPAVTPPAAPSVVFIEAPGAHPPTAAQASPPRVLTLRR